MKYHLATLLVAAALFLDTLSYWRQIKKILKLKKSSQISAMSFIYKIAKEICGVTGLIIYANYVGTLMGIYMLVVYVASLWVIIKYKPKGWSLWA